MWTKNLTAYKRICQEYQDQVPVFFQPWWLDAVCSNGQWKPLVQGNSIWPVYCTQKWGIPYVTLPPLTPRLGWFSPALSPLPTGKMPFFAPYSVQHFAPNAAQEAWFEQKRHRITKRQYYLLKAPFDREVIWEQMNTMSKRQIRKGLEGLQFKEESDAKNLHSMMCRSLQRRSVEPCLSAHALEQIVRAALCANSGLVLSACDEQGKVHASAFFIWDRSCVYFICGGFDERIKQIGASRCLLWKGLSLAAHSHKSFEFGGGSDAGVGAVYAALGGVRQPYYRAVRYWPFFLKHFT